MKYSSYTYYLWKHHFHDHHLHHPLLLHPPINSFTLSKLQLWYWWLSLPPDKQTQRPPLWLLMLYPFDTQTNSLICKKHTNQTLSWVCIDHICWYPICNRLLYYILKQFNNVFHFVNLSFTYHTLIIILYYSHQGDSVYCIITFLLRYLYIS